MYTQADTPQVVARIERDLRHVLNAVRDHDPALRSLVLTGGFARGEGAVLDGAPQNDYDLVAVRGPEFPLLTYGPLRRRLEKDLGLHVDLATVPAWRLFVVSRSIFWYEVRQCGRVLWGDDILDRIPVRHASQIDRAEGLRLLVNRAAGLLLATETADAQSHRLQAAKALLAAEDAHLLAAGVFPPSQAQRHGHYLKRLDDGLVPEAAQSRRAWSEWAGAFKLDPQHAGRPNPKEAWRAAAEAILEAVPVAMRHAQLPDLDAYGQRDGLVDHLVYVQRAARLRGVRPFALHPTGQVRVGTLRLLQESLDGEVRPDALRQCLGGLATMTSEPLRALERLRKATLQ